MLRNVLILFSLSLLTACPKPQTVAPAQPCPTSVGHQAPADLLGVVNGEQIRRGSLDGEVLDELKKIQNESKQREFHALWMAVDDAVSDVLIRQEAQRLGITEDELRDREVGARLVMPSDETVRKIYDDNKDVISVDYEVAAPHIKRQLVEEQVSDLQRAFVVRLRAAADVRISVPPPELPRFSVEVGDAPVWGKDGAGVTVVEFSDFQCPYCGRASQTLKKLRDLYPNDLRIAFRDFPLSQHKDARPAAEAAQCAHEQNKFWEYHDMLFENSRALAANDLKTYAERVGLDMETFASCLASERPKKAVAVHFEAGRRFGVEGTPALFVNGIKLMGLLPLPLMQAIIDRELARN